MTEYNGLLTLEPRELIFKDVRLEQTCLQTLTISNNLGATVDASIRCGSNARYTVSPTSFSLKPGHSCTVDVSLRVLKFAQRKKAAEQGQKDVFHIKATYFDQNFTSTFFLDPAEAGLPAAPASASGAKSLHRLKRTPLPLPDSLPQRDRDRPDRSTHQGYDGQQPERTNSANKPETAAQDAEQRQLMQAILEPHERADEAQQEQQHQPGSARGQGNHQRAHEDADEPHDGHDLPAFSLDKYFLPLKKQPFSQAKHSKHSQSGQDELLQVPKQQLEGPQIGSHHMASPQARAGQRDIEDELLTTIEEQDQVIREKEEVIEHLQSRLRQANQKAADDRADSPQAQLEEQAMMLQQAYDRMQQLEDSNAQLQACTTNGIHQTISFLGSLLGANTQLRGRVQELAADLQGSEEEVAALEGLQEQLAADMDSDEHVQALISAAVAREHAIQESRNRKVLDLLSSKDKVITKFEARFKDAQAEAHEVTAELAEERRRADGADARVAELLEQRAKTRRLQERQLAEAAGLQASLRADVSAARAELALYKREAASGRSPKARSRAAADSAPGSSSDKEASEAGLKAELDSTIARLATAQAEAQELSASLAKASSEMEELQAKLASQQEAGARKDAELEAVHRHREELEAMLAEADRAPEAGRQHSDFGRPEPALLLPAPSGSQGQELTMSASEAGELRAAAAEKTALLAAAEERLARLEALHRIAQETALKGEAQLEETVSALTSLCKLANLDRIEAANAKLLAARLSARVSELVLSEQQARMARPMPSQPQAANAATDPLQQSIATLEAQLSQKDQDLHTALQQLQQAQAAADAPEAQSQGGHSQPQAASVPEEAQPEAASSSKDAELRRLQAELQRVTEAAAQQEEAARQQVSGIRRDAEKRQMQLSVIMETLEALQSGSDGALEERMVMLTADVAASRQEQSATSERAAEVERLLLSANAATEQLRSELAAAQATAECGAGSEAAARASAQAAREELETCRHQLAAQGADLESHATREQALGGQLAALEAQVAAAEERTRDATSGLALAQMTAEQARADAKRDIEDAMARHQASLAAVRSECEERLAAANAAHNAKLEEQRALSEAALQHAGKELAEVTQQAAATLASRPEQAQYMEAVERAEGYHQTVCQLSNELAQLQDQKAVLCEELLQVREDCRAAAIRADTQASALAAIQPLIAEGQDGEEHARDGATHLRTASLARQLAQAKLSEAMLHQQLRIASSAEEALRARLAQREQRLAEVAATLASLQSRAAEDRRASGEEANEQRCQMMDAAKRAEPLVRRLTEDGLPVTADNGRGVPDTTATTQEASSRAEDSQQAALLDLTAGKKHQGSHGSIEPSQRAAAGTSSSGSLQQPGTEGSPAEGPQMEAAAAHIEPVSASNGPSKAYRADVSARMLQLAEQAEDLRMELAQRSAEARGLQGRVDHLMACQGEHERTEALQAAQLAEQAEELQRLSRELKELQIVSRRAIEAASSALGIPLHGDDRGDLAVDQLVDTLILQLQEKAALVKSLQAAAAAAIRRATGDGNGSSSTTGGTAAAAGSVMEGSQRAVIRDLSQKARLSPSAKAELQSQEKTADGRHEADAEEIPRPLSLPAPLPLHGQDEVAWEEDKGSAGHLPALQRHVNSIEKALWSLQKNVLGSDLVREVLLTVQTACFELAAMQAIFDGLPPSMLTHDAMPRDASAPDQQDPSELLATASHNVHTDQEHFWLPEEGPRESTMAQAAKAHTSGDVQSSPAAAAHWQQKAEKWKARCRDLQQEIRALADGAAAREDALKERYPAKDGVSAHSTPGRQQRFTPQRAGREAAERAAAQAQAAERRAGDAEARAGALQQQLAAVRRTARAAQESLQEELESLTAALEQEKGTRARMVASLRDTISGLRAAGDVEGRLKAQVMALHGQAAAAQAAQEEAEARAAAAEMQARQLQQRMRQVKTEAQQQTADAQLDGHAATLRLSDLQQSYARLQAQLQAAQEHAEDMERAVQGQLVAALQKLAALEVEPPQGLMASLADVQAFADSVKERCERLEQDFASARREAESASGDKARAEEAAAHYRARADAAHAELSTVKNRLAEAIRSAQSEQQRADQRQAKAIEEAAKRADAEKAELQQRAAEASAAAVAATEQRLCSTHSSQLAGVQARALAAVEGARGEAARELGALGQQFRAYQAMKAGEVAGLEARLRVALSQPHALSPAKLTSPPRAVKGMGSPAGQLCTAASPAPSSAAEEVAEAAHREGLAAAQREADLERLQCEAARDAAASAEMAGERLREKLAASQKEVHMLKERLSGVLAERRQQACADLGRAQEALKAARAESARRLRDLQQLQVQQQPAPGAGSPAGLAQQLEVETAAREAAEAKLRDAKAGLARHKQMVSDLRKKVQKDPMGLQVDEMGEQLASAQAQGGAQALREAEARTRAAQATSVRKDEMLKELRERMQQLMQRAAPQGDSRPSEAQAATLATVQAANEDLKGELQSIKADRQELQDALTETRSDLVAQLQQLGSRSKALCLALKGAVDLLLHCIRTILTAAGSVSTSGNAGAASNADEQLRLCPANAEAIAAMVDLTVNEVRGLLGRERGDADATAELAQRAQAVLQEADAACSPARAQASIGASSLAGSPKKRQELSPARTALPAWRSSGLTALLKSLQTESEAAERALAAALEQQTAPGLSLGEGDRWSIGVMRDGRPEGKLDPGFWSSQALAKLAQCLMNTSVTADTADDGED